MGRQRCPTTSVMNSLHGNGMEFIHSGNFSIQSSFQCFLARSHYLQAFQQTFSSLSFLSFSLCLSRLRRQNIAMTGQSQWWIPIFFVVTCFRPNKWRKSRHSNKYQRQSWNSFSLTIDTSARRKKHIALYSFATRALDSWAQIKSKQMTSYFFCHIFLLFRFVAAAAAATTTVACITKTVSPIQRLL